MTFRSARVKWVLLGLLTLALWPPARGFLFINEAINATVARQVLLGARLYANAADWKGPLGYLVYAAVLAPTHYNLVALHLLALLLVALLVACVVGLARRLGGKEARLPAAALTVIFLAGTLGPSLEMDLIMALLSAAAYLCLVKFLLGSAPAPPSRLLPVLSGLLLVLATSTKQVAGLDLAALVAACLWLRRYPATATAARRALAPLSLGVVLGVGGVALVVARYSTFRDYLAWAWIIPSVGQHVGLGARLQTWTELISQMVAPVGLIWALGLVAAGRFFRERRRLPLSTPPLPQGEGAGGEAPPVLGLLLPFWLLAGILGVLVGSQALPYHQTQVAAPLALLAALGWTRWLAACPEGAARRYASAVLVIALALSLAMPLRNAAWRWRERVLRSQATDVSRLIGERLAAQTGPGDSLVVISHDPSVLFWSGRRAGSRYLMIEHYWNASLEADLPRFRALLGPLADPSRNLLADVRRHRPKFILIPSGKPWFQQESSAPGRGAWLAELLRGYHLATTDPLYAEYERDGA